MSTETLEQLEAEFLAVPEDWPAVELDPAEALAPALVRVDELPACAMTKRRTGKYCCDG
jgi:hypothetical protein